MTIRVIVLTLGVGLVAGACASTQQRVAGAPTVATPPEASEPPAVAKTEAEPSASSATASVGRSVLDGVFTSSQASNGQRTFRQLCAACHSAGEFSGGPVQVQVGRADGRRFVQYHVHIDA